MGLNLNSDLKLRISASIQDDCLSGFGLCYSAFFKFSNFNLKLKHKK